MSSDTKKHVAPRQVCEMPPQDDVVDSSQAVFPLAFGLLPALRGRRCLSCHRRDAGTRWCRR